MGAQILHDENDNEEEESNTATIDHAKTIRNIRNQILKINKGSENRLQKNVRELHKALNRADVVKDGWLPDDVIIGTMKSIFSGLKDEDIKPLIVAVTSGYNRSLEHEEFHGHVNWITLVECLRLVPMPIDVTEWNSKHVSRWMVSYLHLGNTSDGRLLHSFRKMNGHELLMLPLRERLHSVERAAFQAGEEEEEVEGNRQNENDSNNSNSSSSSNAAANRRRRARRANTIKVAGSYLEAKYDVHNELHRRKIINEIKALLKRRRNQRRTLSGAFKVDAWKTVDVIDWLHYDVKLPGKNVDNL